MIHLSIQTLSTIFNNRAIDSSRTRGLISNPLCDESIISRPSEKKKYNIYIKGRGSFAYLCNCYRGLYYR